MPPIISSGMFMNIKRTNDGFILRDTEQKGFGDCVLIDLSFTNKILQLNIRTQLQYSF